MGVLQRDVDRAARRSGWCRAHDRRVADDIDHGGHRRAEADRGGASVGCQETTACQRDIRSTDGGTCTRSDRAENRHRCVVHEGIRQLGHAVGIRKAHGYRLSGQSRGRLAKQRSVVQDRYRRRGVGAEHDGVRARVVLLESAAQEKHQCAPRSRAVGGRGSGEGWRVEVAESVQQGNDVSAAVLNHDVDLRTRLSHGGRASEGHVIEDVHSGSLLAAEGHGQSGGIRGEAHAEQRDLRSAQSRPRGRGGGREGQRRPVHERVGQCGRAVVVLNRDVDHAADPRGGRAQNGLIAHDEHVRCRL